MRVVFRSIVAAFISIPILSLSLGFSSALPGKKIALTFDDGPFPEATYALIDILQANRAHATFFIVGRVASLYPRMLQDLARAGHELAGHSWTHTDIRMWSPNHTRWELEATRKLIFRFTGQNSFLFRTPGSTEGYIRKYFKPPPGYTLVLWDVHSRDHERGPAEEIAARVLSQVRDGDIVLLHNGVPSTVEALSLLLPKLAERGFEFVTVTELLQHRRALAIVRRPPVPNNG